MAGLLEYMREALAREPGPNPQYGPMSDTLARQEASGGILGAIDPYMVRPMDAPEHRWIRKNLAAKDAKGMVGPDRATMERVGMAGIYAGPGAKTANLTALAKAEKMAAEGASNEAIRRQTGWFRGMDDMWRFEIPDNGARYTVPDSAASRGKVADLYEHKDLFEAYPQLRVLLVEREAPRGSVRGSFTPGFGPIKTFGPDDGSTILHELQHAVQVQEGFAAGGRPKSLNPDVLRKSVDAKKEYDLIAGEIEAADVARRKALGMNERLEMPPTLPEGAIITRFGWGR